MKTVKYGIIGVGNMGSAHANCIYNNEIKGLKLVAICDKSHYRRDWAKENFGNLISEKYKDVNVDMTEWCELPCSHDFEDFSSAVLMAKVMAGTIVRLLITFLQLVHQPVILIL